VPLSKRINKCLINSEEACTHGISCLVSSIEAGVKTSNTS